jgi:hypothetical protein
VHLPTELFGRHLLAVAKTRRGKSSLLLRMVHHSMHSGGEDRSLVLVDPHRDLAVSALGLVPRKRQADVVYLDVSNRLRPFGINLLDVGLGCTATRQPLTPCVSFAVSSTATGVHAWRTPFASRLWRYSKPTKRSAPKTRAHGRGALHTILEVPAVLERPGFSPPGPEEDP